MTSLIQPTPQIGQTRERAPGKEASLPSCIDFLWHVVEYESCLYISKSDRFPQVFSLSPFFCAFSCNILISQTIHLPIYPVSLCLVLSCPSVWILSKYYQVFELFWTISQRKNLWNIVRLRKSSAAYEKQWSSGVLNFLNKIILMHKDRLQSVNEVEIFLWLPLIRISYECYTLSNLALPFGLKWFACRYACRYVVSFWWISISNDIP